jgi:uncharacterized protein (TIRG00374 family)
VLHRVGAWFVFIVALDLAEVCFQAAAIQQFLRPESRMVSYWRVLASQLSGRAINVLTPGGALGEATKVTMLVSHVPRGRVVAAIVMLNLATLYLSVALLVVGVPITALLVDLPHDLKLIVWIGLAVIVPLFVALAIVIRRGALETVLGAARVMRFISAERRTRWTARLAGVDKKLRELGHSHEPGTRGGVLLVCAARLCGWSATTLVLHALGVRLTFTLLVGVFSVGVLISWVSAVVPFGLGLADGGNYALFGVLGAPREAGVFVTLIGRARSLLVAVLGLLVMTAGHTVNRVQISRRHRLRARLEASHHPESPTRSG